MENDCGDTESRTENHLFAQQLKVTSGIYSLGKWTFQVKSVVIFRCMGNRNYKRGQAYRPDDLYHCNTNNGTERLNEDLKYERLETATRSSLNDLLTIINVHLIPSYI